jgi:hypothetical protein
MSKKKTADQESPAVPPKDKDFQGRQLDLFRSFLCNGKNEQAKLSNTFDLWDSVPRYAISRQQMDKIRKAKGFLDLHQVEFLYRGANMKVVIQAARILDSKTNTSKDYYPSANEELIEDALRKIAAEQRNAFFDQPNFRSGVVFTLYMLREELKKQGHSRSYQEIVLSLQILARSTIEIRAMNENGGEVIAVSSYFSGLSAVSKNTLATDPEAKWIVQFHPLVTREIDALTYRQFNYAQMMSHKTQLARWLHKQLSLKFTFASLIAPFEMRYSTIKRDSALLEAYTRQRKATEALDAALNELIAAKVLARFEKKSILGPRGKVEDIIYTLFASMEFSREMKAANKRKQLAEESQIHPEKLSTAPKNR